ncbi:YggT family protein [Nocardioides sp.]|uniref:YggT family protein n=1 Tax=Nocardioides sp. TaxID=35761 RepID=UPI003562136E
MQAVWVTLYVIAWVFFGFLWVRLVVDWVQVFARSWSPGGPLLVGLELVYSVTDPPIKALRRVIPPLRLGSVALDLSFLVVIIVTWLLVNFLRALAYG